MFEDHFVQSNLSESKSVKNRDWLIREKHEKGIGLDKTSISRRSFSLRRKLLRYLSIDKRGMSEILHIAHHDLRDDSNIASAV